MPTQPKVCILSSGRKVNDERIYYKIARSLKKRFPEVTIIAPGEPDHRFDDAIEFVIIPKRRSRWNRIATLLNLYRRAMAANASVYQCEEIDSWLVGWLVAKKRDACLVYDAHEFDPATVASAAPSLIRFLLWFAVILVELFLIRKTQLVLVANEIVRGYFLLLHRFAQVVKVENVPVLSLFQEGRPSTGTDLLLCHEGTLSFNRGLTAIVRLLNRLRRNGVHAKLRIVGDVYGAERVWFEKEKKTLKLEDAIEITGWLKYPDVGAAIEGCHIGLITMQPLASNMLSGQPNKLFNYMRYGLAIVTPDFPEISRIVRKERCGLIYKPGDEEGLFEAVMTLVRDKRTRSEMGRNGKRAVLKTYNWENKEKELLAAYESLFLLAR